MQADVISKAEVMDGKIGLDFVVEMEFEKKWSSTLFVMHST